MNRCEPDRHRALVELKTEALLLQYNRTSHVTAEALYAQMECDRLVERFRDENPDLCSGEDYETARQDFDAFMQLLDAAIECSRREEGMEISGKK
jgi:hypothetical protein